MQATYILGSSNNRESFIIGCGGAYPNYPHHRLASIFGNEGVGVMVANDGGSGNDARVMDDLVIVPLDGKPRELKGEQHAV